MATTRAAVLRENRVTRREFAYARDENVKPRLNASNKHERSNAIHKDEQGKSYSKLAALPKKHLHSDLNAVNARKTTSTLSSQDKQPEKTTKKLEVNRKNSDQESKRLSVSKLKNIFDSIETDGQLVSKPKPPLKPRPKSAVKIPKESEPTINRWSVPTYVNNASTQNYKIYVTEGIAAKRAKFEDSSSESLPISLKEKGSSPKLSDLVPELTGDGMRSRTRSDPGIKAYYKFQKHSKQRSYSDVGSDDDHMHLFEKRHSFDDISIGKPRSFKRLSKSSSVDVLEVGDISQSSSGSDRTIKEEPQHIDYQESNSLECSPTIEDINVDSTKKERIDSGISSSVESSAENSEEMLKPEEEDQPSMKVSQVKPFTNDSKGGNHHSANQPEKRVRDESLIYGRPGEVRQATWKDEEVPPEEPEDKRPVYFAPEVKKEKIDVKTDVNHVEENDDAMISSDDDSNDSFVQHSSPEADTHIPKEPFTFDDKSLVSAFAKKEAKKSRRNVVFVQDEPKKWFTYSAEDYVRGNEEVDPVTASAEWELEKRVEKMDVFSVDLDKDDRGLGLSIIGLGVGTDTGVEKLGIFIKSLTEGGAAEKDGRICVNDQIIEVDGVSLVGVTQIFAAQTLKNTSGTVRFLMGREKGKQPTTTKPASSSTTEQTAKELQELKVKLTKTEMRADRAEAKLKNMEAKLEALTSSNTNDTSDSRTAKLKESLEEANEKLKSAETEVAIAEAENADMLKQLEESKGMYLLLEKRYNALKNKNSEYEEKLERQKKASESKSDSFAIALQKRIKELEQEVKQLKSSKTDSSKSSSKRGVPLTNGTTSKPQERYFSLEAEKFERMAAAQTEDIALDLDIIPSTKPLDNALNLDKKRVAEAQSKAHKPTRASWGCSLEDDFDIFKNGELDYDEEEEEDKNQDVSETTKVERPKQFGQAFALPGFPAGGFKLKPTGRSLMDNSPSEPDASPQQELRSSYPLAVKEKSQNVVVENLLEKQLNKTNQNKVASLPSAIDQEEGRIPRRSKDSDEFLGSSGNSLDEIGEAARRIDSDLASSQASSRGSSPFLPPAMPLLKMKTVPVSESQFNESAVDVPPEMSTDSDSEANIPSPVSFSPTSDAPSIGSGSSRLSNAWLSRPVQEWDVQQVGMWLTGLELEEYVIEFSNKDIDGKQLLNLDTSKMKSMGINQTSRAILKKRIKELKSQTEREGKIKKPKEQRPGKKETSPTPFQDKFEKLGFIKKGKYTVN